ncbi:GNAT family N-acetyltransferase [Kordiimonas lipolytica]|uniref:GNAT family N-acetyltransferase n=1 Tax=Kordiimonas lipolytica TaxID=1662421 RepID=A0ABV8U921_9PROT|nr:GNAT family N-acetyltransferase [Kordiimonas lipolytica]
MITTRDYSPTDWPDVDRIYREGIKTGLATFETKPKAQADFEGKSIKNSTLVATEDDHVLGWAVMWPVSDRCVYGGVAEVSVYVGEDARGKGVGKLLLNALITRSEELGFWTLQAGIFPENEASRAIHEACGFRVFGVRERIGQLHGVWKDNMQLERRSSINGID